MSFIITQNLCSKIRQKSSPYPTDSYPTISMWTSIHTHKISLIAGFQLQLFDLSPWFLDRFISEWKSMTMSVPHAYALLTWDTFKQTCITGGRTHSNRTWVHFSVLTSLYSCSYLNTRIGQILNLGARARTRDVVLVIVIKTCTCILAICEKMYT